MVLFLVEYSFIGSTDSVIMIDMLLDDHVHIDLKDYSTLHNFALLPVNLVNIGYNFMKLCRNVCHDSPFEMACVEFRLETHIPLNQAFSHIR